MPLTKEFGEREVPNFSYFISFTIAAAEISIDHYLSEVATVLIKEIRCQPCGCAHPQAGQGATPPWTPEGSKEAMKETSIRFRLSAREKAVVREWAASSGKPASELIRAAISASISGTRLGLREKEACAAARHAANAVIGHLEERPIDASRLRCAALQMRDAARQVLALA